MEQDFYNQTQPNIPQQMPQQIPQPEQEVPPSPASMPPFWKSKKFLLTFIIIVLLGVGAVLGYSMLGSKYLPVSKSDTVTPTVAVQPSPTLQPVVKSYVNETIGFSFDYPLSWDVKETTDNGVTQLEVTGKEGSIHIAWGTTGVGGGCSTALETIVSKTDTFHVCHGTKSDGVSEGYSGIYRDLSDTSTFSASADVNAPANQNRETVLTIIKSFSFTSQPQQTSTTSWRHYKTAAYTIDYPPTLTPFEDTFTNTVSFTSDKQKPDDSSSNVVMHIAAREIPFSVSPTGNKSQDGTDFITDWKEISVAGVTAHEYSTHQCAPRCPASTIDIPLAKGQKTLTIQFMTQDTTNISQILSSLALTP